MPTMLREPAVTCKKCVGDGWLSAEWDECPDCLGTGRPESPLWVAKMRVMRAESRLMHARQAVASAEVDLKVAVLLVESLSLNSD